MLSFLNAVITAAITIVGGYFLYEHRHFKNKKFEYYEKFFSDISEVKHLLSILILRATHAELNSTSFAHEDLTNKAFDKINSVYKNIPIAKIYISEESIYFSEKFALDLEKNISDATITLSLNKINEEESVRVIFREIEPLIPLIDDIIEKLHLSFKKDISNSSIKSIILIKTKKLAKLLKLKE